MLKNKNIILGVCGSIAAYKAAILIRLLVKAGANVKVILTKNGAHFITPLTLATLSKNPVLSEYFDTKTGVWNNHVALGLWADAILIAPATANTLAELANGVCNSLLAAVYLSAKCDVYVAPAMDLDMWKHGATQKNISALTGYGNKIISPGFGELASGLVGEGRMAEPEQIVSFLASIFSINLPLKGKKILVSAGPTFEAIDPVRFIGNHSSGKMGFALAEELYHLGAEVTLVTGPTAMQTDLPILRIDVTTAREMLEVCVANFSKSYITIMSAAVADYRPKTVAIQKIKKAAADLNLELEKTVDILETLGQQKTKGQILVGFALETHDEENYAKQKIAKKNLDFVVLNSLNEPGAGFKTDTNKVIIFDKNLHKFVFELKTKKEVAKDICKTILAAL
ncbi:phosphopantothenoylcysteine decarboxylase/phosphopantothenate--cysteine ligase [Pedobacter sp. UYP30]|uniref:bifunctional phosphopantothenoylcysteine decarboxylase/phosphopantothenate--cysteine ligase CoaBC n=1 Tax=Pedobacter sp. UYP30 TaxID=1756400 RepID=UPI0033946328